MHLVQHELASMDFVSYLRQIFNWTFLRGQSKLIIILEGKGHFHQKAVVCNTKQTDILITKSRLGNFHINLRLHNMSVAKSVR